VASRQIKTFLPIVRLNDPAAMMFQCVVQQLAIIYIVFNN
jgi:hypothetical protein